MNARAISVLFVLWAGAARAQVDTEPVRRDAAQITRDGTFLPLSLSARVGDQRVAADATAGYDSANKLLTGGVWVEGAILRHVAIRAGVDYLTPSKEASAYGGVRIGILRQERFGIDLGVSVLYKNTGFNEPRGEFEFVVMAGRRWGRVGLFGNLAYGQGLSAGDRDAEARIALLVAIIDRVNIGFDARGRIDLGVAPPPNAPPDPNAADYDLVAGPIVTASVGPVVFHAQTALHTVVVGPDTRNGLIATGGLGACF